MSKTLKGSLYGILFATLLCMMSACGQGKQVASTEVKKTEKATTTAKKTKKSTTASKEQTKTQIQTKKYGFVKVTDIDPDILLEIRYYSGYNFVGRRIDGYHAPIAYLTKQAATALKHANTEFKKDGYIIKIYDAYRPQDATDDFVRWAKDKSDTKMKKFFYPDVDKSKLFESGYIAAKTRHSRGSTVDITIVNMTTGKEIDTGSHFDVFGEISHYDSDKVTEEQKKNRKEIHDVMIENGFMPYAKEWWHFTLEDEPYTDTYFNFSVEN
ncbi:MAG: M15 family metallopeptidase [Anaerostipes sp.]|nr:M15 family metallopeptidase [Anaerostipes sp.]